ncbi:MAG: anti-sigma factor family protein [Myxococcota bacterium]
MATQHITSKDPGFAELLSRYLDDELSGTQLEAMEHCLDAEPEAEEQLQRLMHTRALMRHAYRAELEQVDFSVMLQKIDDAVAVQQPAWAGKLRATESPGIVERLRGWFSSLGWQPLALGGATAAALLLAVQWMPSSGPADGVAQNEGGATPGVTDVQSGGGADAVAQAEGLITSGTEVNDVAGGEASTVTVISSPDNATIIWVQESEGQGGTSI